MARRMLLAVLLLSGLARPLLAEPVSVTLRTDPGDVAVYLLNSAPGGRGIYLGRSSSPLLLEDRYLQGRGSVDFRLEKDGYYPLEHNVKTLALRNGAVIPRDEALHLRDKDSKGWQARDVLLGLLPTLGLALLVLHRSRVPATPAAAFSCSGDKTLDPLIGREICGFLIERVVARGGMGSLYQARSASAGAELAAVKVVDLTGYDDTMKQRFFRELTVASKLHHPGIVKTWDYEVLEERFLAIVMEWLPGSDLSVRMKERVLTSKETVLVMRPVFEAVAYLHDRHIIHRDIKPANIFVLPDGQCKLIDFGLARDESKTGLTATGMFLGTPQYVAPEQIVGKAVHPPVDQYALGLIVYHLVTGQAPFRGDDAMQVLSAQLSYTPPPANEVNPQVPEAFARGISQMIEKNPLSRFPSVMEAYKYLESAA
jgi:hypothetical protein